MEEQLPKHIAEIYELLYNEVLMLHVKREAYRQLYNSGAEVIKLLNFSAPIFFILHRDMLINDILMTMRRLTDKESSYVNRTERDNLSLKYLLSLFDEAKYSTLKNELQPLLDEAENKAKFATGITNRRIAHNDLLTKLKVESLTPFNINMIDDALRSIAIILNTVISHWGHSSRSYESGGMSGDINMLITRLRQAVSYCQKLEDEERDEH